MDSGVDIVARVLAGLALSWTIGWSVFTYVRDRPRIDMRVDAFQSHMTTPYWMPVLHMRLRNKGRRPVTLDFFWLRIVTDLGPHASFRPETGLGPGLKTPVRLDAEDSISFHESLLVWATSQPLPRFIQVRPEVDLANGRRRRGLKVWIQTYPRDPKGMEIRSDKASGFEDWNDPTPRFVIKNLESNEEWESVFRRTGAEVGWHLSSGDEHHYLASTTPTPETLVEAVSQVVSKAASEEIEWQLPVHGLPLNKRSVWYRMRWH